MRHEITTIIIALVVYDLVKLFTLAFLKAFGETYKKYKGENATD